VLGAIPISHLSLFKLPNAVWEELVKTIFMGRGGGEEQNLLGKYGNAIIEKLNLTSFGQKKNTI
jgi:hypothetical protein